MRSGKSYLADVNLSLDNKCRDRERRIQLTNLLHDTRQVSRRPFQRVVPRRLLDGVEPRVYFRLHHANILVAFMQTACEGIGQNSVWCLHLLD